MLRLECVLGVWPYSCGMRRPGYDFRAHTLLREGVHCSDSFVSVHIQSARSGDKSTVFPWPFGLQPGTGTLDGRSAIDCGSSEKQNAIWMVCDGDAETGMIFVPTLSFERESIVVTHSFRFTSRVPARGTNPRLSPSHCPPTTNPMGTPSLYPSHGAQQREDVPLCEVQSHSTRNDEQNGQCHLGAWWISRYDLDDATTIGCSNNHHFALLGIAQHDALRCNAFWIFRTRRELEEDGGGTDTLSNLDAHIQRECPLLQFKCKGFDDESDDDSDASNESGEMVKRNEMEQARYPALEFLLIAGTNAHWIFRE